MIVQFSYIISCGLKGGGKDQIWMNIGENNYIQKKHGNTQV